MKILLINPPFEGKDIERRHRCTRVDPNGWVHPPLPLMYLSSICKEKGEESILLDAIKKGYDNKKIEEICKEEQPNIVIVWTGNFSHEIDIQTLDYVKKALPNTLTVLTGTDIINAEPEMFASKNYIDIVVIGEAELSMYDIIDFKNRKIEKHQIRNIIYKRDGKYVYGPKEKIIDLDTIPFPDRDSIDNNAYRGFPFLSEKFTDILTSRGCLFSCTFCTSNQYWGRGYRARTGKNIADEIELCVTKYGISCFFIVDDEFALHKARAHEFCDEIIKRDIKIKWASQMRVTTIDEPLIKKMAQSGCVYIHYGVEFGNQAELDYFKKKTNPIDSINAFKLTRKYGIESCATVIVGTPDETKEQIKETVRLVKKINPDYFHASPLIPIVGSPYFYTLKEQGRLKHFKYKDYVKPNIIFKPTHLTEEEINALNKQVWFQITFSPRYLYNHLLRVIKKRNWKFFAEAMKAVLWIVTTFIGPTKKKNKG